MIHGLWGQSSMKNVEQTQCKKAVIKHQVSWWWKAIREAKMSYGSCFLVSEIEVNSVITANANMQAHTVGTCSCYYEIPL